MRNLWIVVVLLVLGLVGWAVSQRLGGAAVQTAPERKPAPVEVAAVERGPIELRRTYSGTLEATAEFQVAAKVSARIERLLVDVSDPVQRGQLVAVLDDAEFQQALAQSKADLAVAKATLSEAESSLVIAERSLQRSTDMHGRGVLSDSQLDVDKANQLAKEAAVEVAKARVQRAEAALSGAEIQLGYTQVQARWTQGDDQRRVSLRFVNEGDTVAANAPLFTVIETAPITAVVYVTEQDYGRLEVGQVASLVTDAFPERSFSGTIARVSPVFDAASRQARIELQVPNTEGLLKPGMFVRAEVILDRVEEAVIVPYAALVQRAGTSGVFVVDDAGERVRWRPLEVGIRRGGRVQVTGEGIEGRVVTLGQQLIGDGSQITIPEAAPAPGAPK